MPDPATTKTSQTAPSAIIPRSEDGELVVSFLGHATTLVDMDGTRLLTDPLLRPRVSTLIRHAALPNPAATRDLDAVLLSHFHLDHVDRLSLSMLPSSITVVAPAGARAVWACRRFANIREMAPGDSLEVGALRITATPARHSGRRYPWSKNTPALGYLVKGSQRVFFAGDTGLFPELAELSGDLDVALLPIWGWGLHLREDHLSPETAAQALRLLKPRFVIPIHWGTLLPMGVAGKHVHHLFDPPTAFADHAALLAPEVQAVVLRPGQWARICSGHLVTEGERA